jgi:protein MBA1
MTWKLLKFNSTPKIVSIQPLLLPGKPLTDIQIVYRIESRQRIARIAPGEKEPQVVESDVVDYAAFSFDASKTPARVYFAGTLFECKFNISLSSAFLLAFFFSLIY